MSSPVPRVSACTCVRLHSFAYTHTLTCQSRDRGTQNPDCSLREPGGKSSWSSMPRLRKQKLKKVLLVTRFVFHSWICLVAQHRLSGSYGTHSISVRRLGCVYCGCGKSVICVLNPLLQRCALHLGRQGLVVECVQSSSLSPEISCCLGTCRRKGRDYKLFGKPSLNSLVGF